MNIKRIFLIIILCSFLGTPWGCKKETIYDALPVVHMEPVKMLTSDSAELTGTITSPGASKAEYVGFCYGPNRVPPITENQVFGDAASTTFKTRVNLLQDSTYYLRCFATNSYGYATSNIIKYTVESAKPQVAPCTLADNTIYDQGAATQVAGVDGGPQIAVYGSWAVEAQVQGGNFFRIEFNKVPTNGQYETVNDNTGFNGRGPNRVYIKWQGQAMENGGTVYVSQNTDKTLTFSFCNLTYYFTTTKMTVMGKFTL